MRGSKPVWLVLVVAAITLPLSAAHGLERKGVIRTFVSGLGNDANTATFCSRPKPCRTLAAAYTVTEVGGEIIALDPGEFGPITIAGRLSIFGTQNAQIGVATGGTGVTINAGASDESSSRTSSLPAPAAAIPRASSSTAANWRCRIRP